MATVTKTIKSGGDYTTVQAWENATNLNSAADIWKGVISDNANYDEDIVQDIDGTATTSYVWLDVDAANRHSGVPGTVGRMALSTSTGHAFTCTGDWFRVSGLLVQLDSGTSSQEVFRFTGTDHLLIEQCILWSDTNTSQEDCFYSNGTSGAGTDFVTILNTLMYGFLRCGIHYQDSSGSTGTHTIEIVGSTILKHGGSPFGTDTSALGWRGRSTSGQTLDATLYNSYFGLQDTTNDTLNYYESNGTLTVAGSNNALEDQVFTDNNDWDGAATNSNENVATSSFTTYGTNTNPASTDVFTIASTSITALYEAGLAVSSITMTDTRGDKTVDLIGTARKSTPDIGCLEIAGAVAITRAPGQADLTLDTQAPTQGIDVLRTAPQTDLTLDTQAPTQGIDVLRTAPQTDLTVDTQAPTVTATELVSRTPPQTDLTLDTAAPTTVVPSFISQRAFRFREDGPIEAP